MDVVYEMERVPTEPSNNRPLQPVTIVNCGELAEGEDDGTVGRPRRLYSPLLRRSLSFYYSRSPPPLRPPCSLPPPPPKTKSKTNKKKPD